MAEGRLKTEDRQFIPITFTLNGRAQEIQVEPHELLIDVIRNRFGFTGTKRSCDVQVCGACTVLVDGRPVSSCTYLVFEARGHDVLTIEGLAKNGKLPGHDSGRQIPPGPKRKAQPGRDHSLHGGEHLPLHRVQKNSGIDPGRR